MYVCALDSNMNTTNPLVCLLVCDCTHVCDTTRFWTSAGTLIQPTQLVMPGPSAIAMLQEPRPHVRISKVSARTRTLTQCPSPSTAAAEQYTEGWLHSRIRSSRGGGADFHVFYALLCHGTCKQLQSAGVKYHQPKALDPPTSVIRGQCACHPTNVLNLFLGPPWPTARGADTPQEFHRQVQQHGQRARWHACSCIQSLLLGICPASDSATENYVRRTLHS